jgi:uncharacterized protein (TIGR04255 family)
MKKTLTTPPLVYVQVEFTWSGLPDSNVFNPDQEIDFHRKMLEMGFTDKKDLSETYQEIKLDDQKTRKVVEFRLVFSFPLKDTQVIIKNTGLIIRQTDYNGFDVLCSLAMKVLNALENVPDIGNTGVDIISIHYVDILIPHNTKELKDYVTTNLLPYKPNISGTLNSKGSASSLLLLESSDERIRDLKFGLSILKMKDKAMPAVIPIELQERQQEAAMPLYIPAIECDPNCEYAVLDIRHGVKYLKKDKFGSIDKESVLKSLHSDASTVFWDLLTETALKEWGVING